MKKKLKVLRIFSRLNTGGPSLHVINLTKGLEDMGFETHLIVGEPAPWEGSLECYAQKQKVLFHKLPHFSQKANLLYDIITFLSLLKLILKIKPDIVHTHTFKAGALGRIAAKILRVPLIFHTYHGHLLTGYWGPFKTKVIIFIERALGLITDCTLAVSKKVADDIVNSDIVPNKKMKTIDLGFDINYLNQELSQGSSLRLKYNIPANAFTIAIVGRMVPVKAMDLFLRGTIPLFQRIPNLHLLLVGEGPMEPYLRALATELANDEDLHRIHFTGWIYPFVRELNDINLMLCTSKNEGTSVAIIEAMIAKIPVISTSVGGMPDLLQYGRLGSLIPEDEKAIEQKCFEIYQKANDSEFKNYLNKVSSEIRYRYDQNKLFYCLNDLYREFHA